MRCALPLWHCLDYDTQKKLRLMAGEGFSIPPFEWKIWQSPAKERTIDDYKKYKRIARFMKQRPEHPAQVK